MELKDIFTDLVMRYSDDAVLCNKLWNEIEKSYSHKKRYYHNLSHIKSLIEELKKQQHLINNCDVVLFSVFYHDIVYNVLKKDNEEKSAETAIRVLRKIKFPDGLAEQCHKQIIATKVHEPSGDNDTDLFTDADLSILGQERSVYEKYCQQIRKEYSVYPDIIYKPGRRKVIAHFLQMGRIFKTDAFYQQYEQQAKENLQWELSNL